LFIASAVDLFQPEQQICSQLGEHNPSAARVQYLSQGMFLWGNTLPTSMKLLTINSSGCRDQSNIAFYWSPGGLRSFHQTPQRLLRRECYCECRGVWVGNAARGGSGAAHEGPPDKDRGQILLCDRARVWFRWTIKGDRFFFYPRWV